MRFCNNHGKEISLDDTKIRIPYQLLSFLRIMKCTVLLIGMIIVNTFMALIFSADATRYLYNQTWLANGNEIPECLMHAFTVVNCPQTDREYLDGLFWWSNTVEIGILILGTVLSVMTYKRRPVARRHLI
jgi:hypothetical protein